MTAYNSLGIDFGTSNSTCALASQDDAHLVALEDDKFTLPSAIFFNETGEICYGRHAIKDYIDGEDGRLMRGLKSVLGTALINEKTLVNNRARSFIDIITIYLKQIAQHAAKSAGNEIDNLVLGRPVHFHENDTEADAISQKALEDIARGLGFKHIEFQYEPIAAAFAHERRLSAEQLALVVDLGGGTSDFSVIRLAPNMPLERERAQDVLATSGVRVGGTNFDQNLSINSFMPYLGLGSEYCSEFDEAQRFPVPPKIYFQLSDWPMVNFAQGDKAIRETRRILRTAQEPHKIERLLTIQNEKLGHAFLQKAEHCKITLSEAKNAHESLQDIDLDFDVSLSRDDFEAAIKTQIDKVERSMLECLSRAGVNNEQINIIILTGGSSELPIINQMVTRHFPSATLSKDDKFSSVGLGLAYHARQIF